MENVYTKGNGNVYYHCRKKAEAFEPRFRSRSGAADILGISAVSLRDYETGVTKVVPADIVTRMSNVYKAPELRSHYCADVCPIGKAQSIYRVGNETLELDRLTLRLISSFKDIANIKEMLIDIAADGEVDETEKDELNYVMETLDNISRHVQELRLWAEKQFGDESAERC